MNQPRLRRCDEVLAHCGRTPITPAHAPSLCVLDLSLRAPDLDALREHFDLPDCTQGVVSDLLRTQVLAFVREPGPDDGVALVVKVMRWKRTMKSEASPRVNQIFIGC